MAKFICDQCGLSRNVPDSLSGRKAKCPECSKTIVIQPEGDPFPADLDALAMENGNSEMDIGDAGSEESVDIICAGCGNMTSVPAGQKVTACAECGRSLEHPETGGEPSIEDVDLDDLADGNPGPRIWDEEYEDGVQHEVPSTVEAIVRGEQRSLGAGGLFPNIYAGLVSGLLSFFFAVAYAQFVVTQVGIDGLFPHAVGMGLVSSAIVGMIVALRSRIPFAMGAPDAVLTTLLFLYVGSMSRFMGTNYPAETVMPTILAAVAVAAFATGVGLWLLGLVRAGRWVRYVPVQVLGGVFGAVGVYVLFGAWDIISASPAPDTNRFVTLQYAFNFLNHPVSAERWIPSVAFGALLFVGLYRVKHTLAMVALIIAGIGISHATGFWNVPDAFRFLSPGLDATTENTKEYFAVLTAPGFFDRIRWGVIIDQNLYIGAMVVLSMLRIMYRSTCMESRFGYRADLDGEYKAAGIGGMVAALAGGIPATISYGRTEGSHAAGARGGLSGLIAAAVCGGLFFCAHEALSMIPRFIPEGMLIYVGLSLVRDWLFRTRTAFTRRDDKRLLIITFLMTICLGMLIGIGFGVAMAMMIIVSRNSRGGAVKNELSGAVYRSNVDRAPAQLRVLKESGDHIYILRMHGFIFLGTMYDLIGRINRRINDPEQLPVEYIVIDFKLVTGFASATHIGFAMLRDLSMEKEIEIVFTSSPLELEEHLEKGGYALNDMEGSFKMFMNLDYALEWCENQILEAENLKDMKQLSLPDLLEPVFPEPKYIPALMKVLKKRVYIKGDAVIRQGDSSDTMYFVESGTLNVELETEGRKTLRLKKVGPGAVFGEMGIYTSAPRSATVRAAEKCVVYQMTLEKLKLIEKKAPTLVTVINHFLVNMLADKLVETNRKVHDLM